MKRLLLILVASLTFALPSATAQIYAKLNALYAVVGVVNPQVEAVVAPHSTIAVDATFSPWRSVGGRHLFFGMFNGEYRYYFKGATNSDLLSVSARAISTTLPSAGRSMLFLAWAFCARGIMATTLTAL